MAGFTVRFNVEEGTEETFREFIENLRQQLRDGLSSHHIPILRPEPPEGTPPNGFFDVVVENGSHIITFRFRMDNLYLIGYQMPNGHWMEFTTEENKKLPVKQRVHLIQGSEHLPYTGDYGDLTGTLSANRSLRDTPVGYMPLIQAVNTLATATSEKGGGWRAKSLVTVIVMISEAVRMTPVLQFIVEHYWSNDNVIGESLVGVIHSWGNVSERVLRDENDPNYTFQMPQPNQASITTLAQAIAMLGVLKNNYIQRRFPRDVSFADSFQPGNGQIFAEVFSVRIDNIDGEDPGQLYGTIWLTDGINSQCLYDRKSNDCESIKPGKTCTLTGPSRCISAYDSFTINLDLKDHDTLSPDDEVSRGQMTWNVYDFTNKYNVLLSQKIDGKYGSATVNYAVYKDVVQATIEVTLIDGDGEDPANVYGSLVAQDNLLQQEIRLFRISAPKKYIDVRPGERIPLSRSTMVASLGSSLIVWADLFDYDPVSSDDSIARGDATFLPQLSGTSTKIITGPDGKIEVKVTWYNN